jgi:hypothetical protein
VANAFGDDPGNWTAAPPSAGRPTSAGGNVPAITSQPQPASVLSGETVSLTVGAQGSAPLFYQWRRNGANIAGATNAALALPAITPAQAGDYNVVVYNQAGSAVSSNATVSVRLTLVILQQPRSVATNAGGNVSFSVLAYSPGPVSYQWLKDDQELAGATSSSLSISNVQPSAAGAYVVRMTDQYGTYRSVPATLLVLVPPLIVQQPLSQSVLPGDLVVLSVTVTNTATLPITALWRRNGTFFQTNTFQSTNAFLVITNAQPPFTNYQAVITNLARILGFPTTNAFLTFLTDSDGDGLPDAWETTYFNDPSSADPDADPDGDSMSNRAEYLAGTDPTDPSSYLRIDPVTAAPDAVVSFLARPQRTYTVEYSDNLAPGSWRKLADFGAVPSTRVQFATDPSYAQATNRLYRLVTPRRP